MNILQRIRCIFSPRAACTRWNSEEDETIRYMRTERRAAEEAAAKIRRSHFPVDPITRVYGGWDREERKR